LSGIIVFSHGDKMHYVTQAELDALVKKQVTAVKKKEELVLTARE